MSVQATTWVWEHSRSQASARLVLLAIADAANREGEHSCQTVATLSRMVRMSERTVQRALRDLAALGEIEQEPGQVRGYPGTAYRLPGCQSVTPPSSEPRGVTQVTPGGDTGVTGGVTQVTPNPSTNPKELHTRVPADADTGATLFPTPAVTEVKGPSFDAFWAAYPPGRKQAKARCADRWAALSAQHRTTAMARLYEDCQSPDWQKDAGRYVPAPLTWLNKKRWLDDEPGPVVPTAEQIRQAVSHPYV